MATTLDFGNEDAGRAVPLGGDCGGSDSDIASLGASPFGVVPGAGWVPCVCSILRKCAFRAGSICFFFGFCFFFFLIKFVLVFFSVC
jgi:hypothetical protein